MLAARAVARIAFKTLPLEGARGAAAARERVAGVREAPAEVRSYIHTAEVRSYIQVCVRLRQRSGPMHAAALVYQCMRP